MTRPTRILCVHGVGGHPADGEWEGEWRAAIERGLSRAGYHGQPQIDFVHYDDIFAAHPISAGDMVEAVGKLLASGFTKWVSGSRSVATRGQVSESLRWTAGMVVQWVENQQLRRATRERLATAIRTQQPDVICGHSLGSLVCYDTFTTTPTAASVTGKIFVSLGSQIGNAFVVGNFHGGRIQPLADARHWYHLYNDEDAAFTAPIRLHTPNFEQVMTPFDEAGVADHSAAQYLGHPNTQANVWTRVVAELESPRVFSMARGVSRAPAVFTPPRHRALLIGINRYPRPEMELQGCVNDVFLMSSFLQESGFDAEDVRIVLDERATARGILERLEWLLDNLREGDTRILYYSGHGAQMPSYGVGDIVDRRDETLVPYDFDWSPEHAITDDQFFGLYSQIPSGVRFAAIFDCCHSGGLTRDGQARVRGITAPDDIRHRELRWDPSVGMWKPRDLGGGRSHGARRLFQGSTFDVSEGKLARIQKARGHEGAYQPVLLYACEEHQFAYEYQHGNVAHGAYTFALVRHLRAARDKGKSISFSALTQSVGTTLDDLGYQQTPVVVATPHWLAAPVPFVITAPTTPASRRKKSGRRTAKARSSAKGRRT